jgi:polyphosphate kinase
VVVEKEKREEILQKNEGQEREAEKDLKDYATEEERQQIFLIESQRLGFEEQIDVIDKEKDPSLKLDKNKFLLQKAEQQKKLNSILDEEFVEAFYRASMAGVQIDLIVRGICAVRVGIPGVSENIRVRSILGRFLEHSRIFHFANGGEDEIYIGSADLMDRNLNRRVESLVRIVKSEQKQQLIEVIDQYLDEKTSRWEMLPTGKWQKVSLYSDGSGLNNLQEEMISKYRRDS